MKLTSKQHSFVEILIFMKKNKQKTIVKESRKAAKQEIKETMIDALKKITAKYGQSTKKIEKTINKGATQLADKLSKTLHFVEPTTEEKPVEAKPVKAPKKTTAKLAVKKTENT